jgi:phosphopantothenate synthetase
MFNYQRAQETASRLIASFGEGGKPNGSIVRTSKTGPAWEPVTQQTAYSVKLVTMEYSDKNRESQLIQVGDKKVYVSVNGLPITPTEADRVVVDGVSHAIISVKKVRPANVTVFYELQARK